LIGLNGTIGEELSNFTNLQKLVFNSQGASPPQIQLKLLPSFFDNKNLVEIELHSITLRSPLPAMGSATALQTLSIQHCHAYGSLPDPLPPSIQDVYLTSNDLNGWKSLPSYYAHIHSIGTIPESYSTLLELKNLYLLYNDLDGPLPTTFAPNLTTVYLTNNALTGPFPSYSNSSVSVLSIADNPLNCPLPEQLPPELTILYASDAGLSGELPENLPMQLRNVYLYNNNISGGIPESYGTHPALKRLFMENNELSGEIPSSLFDSLIVLDFGENGLTCPSVGSPTSGSLW